MPYCFSRADEERRVASVRAVIERKIDELTEQREENRSERFEYRNRLIETMPAFDLEDPANLTERESLIYSADLLNTQVENASAEIERLRRLRLSPYFGRIDVLLQHRREETPVYIGLHSLWDGSEHLIYDWRAPIAGLFYDYGLGPASYTTAEGEVAGEILLKRQYRFENGELAFLFDNDVVINDTLLQEALARHAGDRMRNIVTTIQREQNRAIRDEEAKYLLILGPAGSGKTAIALHRSAYLLYRYRGSLRPENVMILSPNEIFSDYIANVLPELGEENILRFTFDDIAEYAVGRERRTESKFDQLEYLYTALDDRCFRDRAASIRFKSGRLLPEILYRHADRLAAEIWRFRNVSVNGRLVCTANEVAALFAEHCASLPLVKGGEKLIDILATRAKSRNDRVLVSLQRQVEAMMAETDIVRLYRRLLASPARLRELCPPDRELPAEIEAICRFTTESLDGDTLLYEDVAPIILLEKVLSGRETKKPVSHLLIDEVQDYTTIQLEYLKRQFPGVSVTALGDGNQAINPFIDKAAGENFLQVFTGAARKSIHLEKSYRSTREIALFARALAGDRSTAVEDVRQGGEKPRLIRGRDRRELDAIYARLLDGPPAGEASSLAIICKSARRARAVHHVLAEQYPDLLLITGDMAEFRTGRLVIPVYLAKGLEFDTVMVDDAGVDNYDHPWYRTILYTACTRAMQRLIVTCAGEPSSLLQAVEAELYIEE